MSYLQLNEIDLLLECSNPTTKRNAARQVVALEYVDRKRRKAHVKPLAHPQAVARFIGKKRLSSL
jgi:hypothetical protein